MTLKTALLANFKQQVRNRKGAQLYCDSRGKCSEITSSYFGPRRFEPLTHHEKIVPYKRYTFEKSILVRCACGTTLRQPPPSSTWHTWRWPCRCRSTLSPTGREPMNTWNAAKCDKDRAGSWTGQHGLVTLTCQWSPFMPIGNFELHVSRKTQKAKALHYGR